MEVSFIGRGNWSTRRKPPTCRNMSLGQVAYCIHSWNHWGGGGTFFYLCLTNHLLGDWFYTKTLSFPLEHRLNTIYVEIYFEHLSQMQTKLNFHLYSIWFIKCNCLTLFWFLVSWSREITLFLYLGGGGLIGGGGGGGGGGGLSNSTHQWTQEMC